MVQANCSLSHWTNAGEKLQYEMLSYRLSTSARAGAAAATLRPCFPPSARAVQIGKSGDEGEMEV
ncbi:hypothetical protein C2845_PM03G17370 [Panicum miliaceum]|uniref:Uncharacterized protein n=1 Tax=Panicum miliaceum TaxID=4540 RepID=A0A3L6T8D6_PANMI|nr:hypothetical protein C2845_PM03G17370 [Panicum miliaceum]